jgi:hypothetical protein
MGELVMRYVHTQSGAALVILLTIFILGSLTFLLAEVNERSHYLIEDQKQTIQALNQAKESLLGFAVTYAQNHEVKLQGYLPCPDKDGDGSVNSSKDGKATVNSLCNQTGRETILGRLPWRTLGLPPLRDGSGECLWYAVSGNFKDFNKQVLTSDSNGLVEIVNAKAEMISNQAIAVILAPGRSLKGQEDRYKTTGRTTECGSEIENQVIDPINHVRYYLDKYNFNGVVIDNVTANNSIFYSTDNGYFSTSPNINVTPRFINAPPVYETYLNPQDGTERIDPANPTFNDTLLTITPEDFKPVYRMMDYQVATQVRACLDRYAQQNLYHFIDSLQTLNISSDQNNTFTFMKKVSEITNNNDLLKKIKDNILDINNEIPFSEKMPYPKYPWPSSVSPYDYTDDENNYFGRIPTQPVEHVNNINLLATRNFIINLLDYDPGNTNSLVVTQLRDLWGKFEQHYSINLLNQWPVDPQEAFSIFDLHELEYEKLKENDSPIGIEEIKEKVINTLEDKAIVMVLEKYFHILGNNTPPLKDKIDLNQFKEIDIPSDDSEFNSIKNYVKDEIIKISAQETLINNIKDIKYILENAPDQTLSDLREKYQCFFFGNDPNLEPQESDSKWWWWKGWRDKVFFAIHSDYSLNNAIKNPLTFETEQEEGIINAEMLVLVAGRSLNGQQRSQDTQKTNITNYLEGKNSDNDTHFIHAPVRSTFNDILL